jgi:hypothetical protein
MTYSDHEHEAYFCGFVRVQTFPQEKQRIGMIISGGLPSRQRLQVDRFVVFNVAL